MMLRIWIAGALVGLPLLVSGALAQTPATPPAVTTSSAPPANPAGPPAATPSSTPLANPASPPASTQGLVSPFMPMPVAPTAGADSTPGAPSSAGRVHSGPGPRAAEAEESRAAAAAARDRAQRRS